WENALIQEIFVTIVEVLLKSKNIIVDLFNSWIQIDVTTHEYSVEPISETADVVRIMTGQVFAGFGKVSETGIRQFFGIFQVLLIARCRVQVGSARKHGPAVVGESRSHAVATNDALPVSHAINRFGLWISWRAATHHIIVHAIGPQQVFL